jgi:hypothetical protein
MKMNKQNNIFLPLNYNNNINKIYAMETTTKINGKKNRITATTKPKKKSKWTLFREKYPNGIVTILDEEAVLQ